MCVCSLSPSSSPFSLYPRVCRGVCGGGWAASVCVCSNHYLGGAAGPLPAHTWRHERHQGDLPAPTDRGVLLMRFRSDSSINQSSYQRVLPHRSRQRGVDRACQSPSPPPPTNALSSLTHLHAVRREAQPGHAEQPHLEAPQAHELLMFVGVCGVAGWGEESWGRQRTGPDLPHRQPQTVTARAYLPPPHRSSILPLPPAPLPPRPRPRRRPRS